MKEKIQLPLGFLAAIDERNTHLRNGEIKIGISLYAPSGSQIHTRNSEHDIGGYFHCLVHFTTIDEKMTDEEIEDHVRSIFTMETLNTLETHLGHLITAGHSSHVDSLMNTKEKRGEHFKVEKFDVNRGKDAIKRVNNRIIKKYGGY